MNIEVRETSALPQRGIRQELIDNIRELVRLNPPVREALFGHLADHLAIVCQERLPDSDEVAHLLERRLALVDLGVWEDIIGRSELAVLASQSMPSEPGKLWTNVMVATEMNVAGFGELSPLQVSAKQNHLRVFLTAIDGAWARSNQVVKPRFPDKNDALRYQQSFEKTVAAGINPRDLKHAELIGAAVFIKHYMLRAGGEMNG